MPYTNKYAFPEMPTGAVEWPSLFNDYITKAESFIQTYLRYPLLSGENIIVADPLCIQNNSWRKAALDGNKQPVVAFAIEASSISGEYIRGKRVGQMTNVAWSLNGSGEVFLTAGGSISHVSGEATNRPVGASVNTNTILIEL